MKKYLIFIGIFLIWFNTIYSQPIQNWVARFNGIGNYIDQPRAMALDNNGNVIVFGYSWNSGVINFCTMKYDPSGNLKWQTFRNNTNTQCDPYSVTTDLSGNVYVVGQIGVFLKSYIIKYDSTGNQIWENTFTIDGLATSVITDSLGNIYVAGQTKNSSYDLYVVKYNSLGNIVWSNVYNGSANSEDLLYSLALDYNSNIVATGYVNNGNGGNMDICLIKYSNTGQRVWERFYNGSGNSSDLGRKVVVDKFNNIYVGGVCNWFNKDFCTIKYSSEGILQWVREYNGTGNGEDYAWDLTVDDSSNVFIVGKSRGSSGLPFMCTIKYDKDGNSKWVNINDASNESGQAIKVCLDKLDNVYIAGDIGNTLDFCVIKYNNDGVKKWETRYNGPGNSTDGIASLMIDNAFNIYISGRSYGIGTDQDYCTIKYSQPTFLNLVSPNGGEILYGGRIDTLKWSSSNIGNINIELTTNNGTSWVYIGTESSSKEKYIWCINNINATNCKIRISDASNSTIKDISDNSFTIRKSINNLNSGLIAYYPFESNANDFSGYGKHGTIMNHCEIVNGKVGNGIKFFGSPNYVGADGGHIILPSFAELTNYPQFTITFWIKYENLTHSDGEGYLFFGNHQFGHIGISNFSNNINFSINSYDGFNYPSSLIDQNNFVYYTLVYDNGILRGYRNSQLIQSIQCTHQPNIASNYYALGAHTWGAGTSTGSTRLTGIMDEVRIYKRALSNEEINQLYGITNTNKSITVTSPNGGENWEVGQSYNINWTSNNVAKVKIEISTNNGSNWSAIAYDVDAYSGGFSYTSQNSKISDNCKIRVSEKGNPSLNDESNNVFSISANNNELLYFQIRDNFDEVKKVKLLDDTNTPIIKFINSTSKDVTFSANDFTNNSDHIKKIELLGISNQIIGHTNFYRSLKNNLNIKYEAIINVDISLKASDAGYGNGNNNPNWNYYSNENERLISLLIPKNRNLSDPIYSKMPLLLVHGVGGKFSDANYEKIWPVQEYRVTPYWDSYIYSSSYIDSLYDVWEFYYPEDQKIETSSLQMMNVLDYLISSNKNKNAGLYSSRVTIIAHSMGGLVTRKFIQSNNYDSRNNIRKLLMLGTPNHGSNASFKLKYTTQSVFGYYVGKDKYAPAYSEMIPGSAFLMDLNSTSTKYLYSGSIINKTYLVIAGKENKRDYLFEEIMEQDDEVVSVSSANMYNKNIPLATIYKNHSNLPKATPSVIISSFVNEDYDPNINNKFKDSIINNVDGYWLTKTNILKSDNKINPSLDKSRGVVVLKTNNLNINADLKVEDSLSLNNNYKISVKPIISSPDFTFKRVPNTFNYFFSDNRGIQKGLGFYINNPEVKNFTFEYKSGSTVLLTKSISSFINPLETNDIMVNFTDGEAYVLNHRNFIFPGIFKRGQPKTSYLTSTNITKKDFYIDSALDTIMFFLKCNSSDTAFLNSQFKLIDANNNIIDSIYASTHLNIKYYKNYADSYEYYYIFNPTEGIWSANYNSNLIQKELFVPVGSSITTYINYKDSIYYVNDTVNMIIKISSENIFSNTSISGSVNYSTLGNDTIINSINLNFQQLNDSTFSSSFIVNNKGSYNTNVILNCLLNGKNIERHFQSNVTSSKIKPPIVLSPKQDSSNVNTSCIFNWSSRPGSILYEYELYNINLNYYEKSLYVGNSISYQVDSLEYDTDYLWRVKALSLTDSSDWSAYSGFKTRKAYSTPPELYSPPDISGGVVVPITFSWYPSYQALTYNLVIATDSLFNNVVINDTAIIDTTVAYSNLNSYTTYYWKVRSNNAAGSGSYSKYWKFRSLGLPALVNTVSPVNNTINKPVRYVFQWQKTYDEADKYIKIGRNIFRVENQTQKDNLLQHFGLLRDNINNNSNHSKFMPDNVWSYWYEITADTVNFTNVLKDSLVTDTTKVIFNLEHNKTYYWRVKSQNEIGWSGFCQWSKFSTIVAPNITSIDSIKIGGNSITHFGISDIIFTADVASGTIDTVKFNTFDPITVTKPSELISISNYYWLIKGSSDFSNGKISIPLSKLKGVTDSSKLVWVKRTNAGDNWQNIGGLISNGRLESNNFFNTLGEFAIASLDSQSLKSTFVITKVSFEGYHINSPNYKLLAHDTVRVYLHQSISPYNLLDSSITILDSTNLLANVCFTNINTGNYYLRIKHRNSIETWSRVNGDSIIKYSTMFYNFTNSQASAFGSNLILKDSVWCIYSGDVNQDGVIDLTDLLLVDNDAYNGASGYYLTDVNGDGVVDLSDLLIVDNNAYNGIYAMLPSSKFMSKKQNYLLDRKNTIKSDIKEKKKNGNKEKKSNN